MMKSLTWFPYITVNFTLHKGQYIIQVRLVTSSEKTESPAQPLQGHNTFKSARISLLLQLILKYSFTRSFTSGISTVEQSNSQMLYFNLEI